MEILFSYRKRGYDLGSKSLKLPDTPAGVLALELDDGRYLEIAQVCQGEVIVSGAIHDDSESLHGALFEFEDDYPRRRFAAQLKDFAATNPAPLELVVFAGKLAAELGIDLDDLAVRLAGQQLELSKAAE